MIYEVVTNFRDLECEGKLRTLGMLLTFEDDKRAKELAAKNLIKERTIDTVPAKKKKAGKKVGA